MGREGEGGAAWAKGPAERAGRGSAAQSGTVRRAGKSELKGCVGTLACSPTTSGNSRGAGREGPHGMVLGTSPGGQEESGRGRRGPPAIVQVREDRRGRREAAERGLIASGLVCVVEAAQEPRLLLGPLGCGAQRERFGEQGDEIVIRPAEFQVSGHRWTHLEGSSRQLVWGLGLEKIGLSRKTLEFHLREMATEASERTLLPRETAE